MQSEYDARLKSEFKFIDNLFRQAEWIWCPPKICIFSISSNSSINTFIHVHRQYTWRCLFLWLLDHCDVLIKHSVGKQLAFFMKLYCNVQYQKPQNSLGIFSISIKCLPESLLRQQWPEPSHSPPSRESQKGPSGRQKLPYSPEKIFRLKISYLKS